MAVELYAEQSGSGLPLVLLHAFPLDHRLWDPQRAALSGAARVIAPDLRGFGRSPLGADEPGVDVMADDVAALLDRLGLDRVVLAGISMGGSVAMAFARRHGDRLLGLALCDTKAAADAEPGRAKRLQTAERALAAGAGEVGRMLREETLPGLLGDTTKRSRPAVVTRVESIADDASPEAVAWAQRALAARPDSMASLRAVDVPALVVVGAEDPTVTVADADAMAAALPRGRVVVVPAAGHFTPLENPDRVSDALRGLLAEVAGPRAG